VAQAADHVWKIHSCIQRSLSMAKSFALLLVGTTQAWAVPEFADVLQAAKSEMFPSSLPLWKEKRIIFSRNAANMTSPLLPREGLEDILASTIVSSDEVRDGDLLEVVVHPGAPEPKWDPCVVLHSAQNGTLDVKLLAPSKHAGERVQLTWGLARRYPWRYAVLNVNETILVGTWSGWQPARLLHRHPDLDSIDISVMATGEVLRSVQPRYKTWSDHPAALVAKGVTADKLAVGERIKVQTSRGWEIATVLKKAVNNTLDIKMFPDGEELFGCQPLIKKPKLAANESALALWAENQRLRRRIAILSSLKAVYTSTAMAKVAWQVARHHIDEYVREYQQHGLPAEFEDWGFVRKKS